MPDDSAGEVAAEKHRSYRSLLWSALLVFSAAATFLILPALAPVPARVIEGCAKWIATAAGLELLSALGFVVFFKLVFAAPISWQTSTPAAGAAADGRARKCALP